LSFQILRTVKNGCKKISSNEIPLKEEMGGDNIKAYFKLKQ